MGNKQTRLFTEGVEIGEPRENDDEYNDFGDALDLSHRSLEKIPNDIRTSECNFHEIQLFNNRLINLDALLSDTRSGGHSSGLIPSILHCRRLNIAGNCLKGLPSALGEMKNLVAFDAGFNQLEHIDANFLNLPHLESLVLRHNRIRELGTPDGTGSDFSVNTSLKHLDLSGNQMVNLPGRLIYNLRSLEELLMAGNELEVVDGIECLSPRLVTLDLSSNFIVQLPACAFEPIQGQANFALTGSLTTLMLHNQHERQEEQTFFSWSSKPKDEEEDTEPLVLPMMLKWNVYHTIRRAENMTTLNLSSLGLETQCFLDPDVMSKIHQDPTYQPDDVPDDALSHLVNLTDLDLSFNKIGIFSPAIGNMTKLKRLVIRNNEIPKLDGLKNLTELEELDAQYNYLTSIPIAINNLKQLSRLLLNNNRLKSIPATLMHCNKLRELTINFNSLMMLPEELGTLELSSFTFHPNTKLSSPPKDIQAQGPDAMLAWMRARVAHSKFGADNDAQTESFDTSVKREVDLNIELWGTDQSFGCVQIDPKTTLSALRDIINLELDTAPERYQFVCDNCAITGEVEHRELALTYMPTLQLYDQTTKNKDKPDAAGMGMEMDLEDTRKLKDELLRQLRRMKMTKAVSFTPQDGKDVQVFKMPNPMSSKKK